MLCQHCGQVIPDMSRFCPKCGKNLVSMDNGQIDISDNTGSKALNPSTPAEHVSVGHESPRQTKDSSPRKMSGLRVAARVIVAVTVLALVAGGSFYGGMQWQSRTYTEDIGVSDNHDEMATLQAQIDDLTAELAESQNEYQKAEVIIDELQQKTEEAAVTVSNSEDDNGDAAVDDTMNDNSDTDGTEETVTGLVQYNSSNVIDVSADYPDYTSAWEFMAAGYSKRIYTTFLQYELKDAYDTLSFVVIPDKTCYDAEIYVSDVDTGEILLKDEAKAGELPRTLTADISGHNKIQITNNTGFASNSVCYILDATVTSENGESEALIFDGAHPASVEEDSNLESAVNVTDLDSYSGGLSLTDKVTTEILEDGTLYTWKPYIHLYPENYAVYYVGNKYDTLSFEFIPDCDNKKLRDTALTISNEETGDILYSTTVTKGTSRTDVKVDIEGVQYLRIEAGKGYSWENVGIYMHHAYFINE